MISFLARLFGRAEPRFVTADQRQAGAIAALHARSFHRGWSDGEVQGLLRDPAVLAHAASLRGRPVGFILSRKAADEAEIFSVAVEKARRGGGIGRGLLDIHLRTLAGHGSRAVFLEVEEGNTAALRLYRRAGFRQVGQRPNYYPQPGGTPATALILRRDLR